MIFALTTILLIISSGVAQPTPEDFLIDSLPGLTDPINFKQYSGFVEATPGVELFFHFVESQDDPSTDPLFVWYNGGPGSSSYQYGFWL